MKDFIDRFWPQLLIALAVLLTFWPVLGADFLAWDDFQLVTQNYLVSEFSARVWWSFDPELYIPLVFLSFQIQHLLFGYSDVAFHGGNLLLHIANACLVFSVLFRLSQNRMASLAGALLFSVHPLSVEAVAWVSARKELLMAFFALLSVRLFLSEEENGKGNISVLAFLGSLLSKITSVMLAPVLLILLFVRDGRITRHSRKRLLPFFALAILLGVVAILGKQHTFSTLTPLSTLLLSTRSLLFYVEKLLWPAGLSAIYPAPDTLSVTDPLMIIAIVLSVLMIAGITLLLRRGKMSGFAGAWMILFLLPSFLSYEKSNIVMLAADRYMYVSLAGAALLFALTLRTLFTQKRHIAVIIAAVILLPCAYIAHQRTYAWQSTESLFTDVLSVYPGQPIALNNIAFIRMEAGDLQEALSLGLRAVEGNDRYADAYANIGVIQARLGDLMLAEQALKKALSIDGTHVNASHNLAGIYFTKQDYATAEKQYEQTLEIQSDFPSSLYQLARVKLRLGKTEEARNVYRRLLELDDDYRGKDPALDRL